MSPWPWKLEAVGDTKGLRVESVGASDFVVWMEIRFDLEGPWAGASNDWRRPGSGSWEESSDRRRALVWPPLGGGRWPQ